MPTAKKKSRNLTSLLQLIYLKFLLKTIGTFPYVLCQLSSKPADQKHISGVEGINDHSLTHVWIISPVLQKFLITSETQKE
jgi:hypothetical protein